jgi:hypothetical protein
MANSSSILKTLLYSDIFNYPLKKEEIWRYLIANKEDAKLIEDSQLQKIKKVAYKDGFYFLKGKDKIVSLRKKREKESLKKLVKAKKVIEKIFLIPTVKFIGISGNLAANNAGKKDDIDLFIVTKKDTIWLTRFLIVIVLRLLKVYRRRGERNVKDKFCCNMFLDEEALPFDKNQQDLFTARELAQLKPIKDRGDVYNNLILSNKWLFTFLPNSFNGKVVKKEVNKKKASAFLRVINGLAKIPQLIYMKKHKTNEEVSDKKLAFHPKNNRDFVLKSYKEKLKAYGL